MLQYTVTNPSDGDNCHKPKNPFFNDQPHLDPKHHLRGKNISVIFVLVIFIFLPKFQLGFLEYHMKITEFLNQLDHVPTISSVAMKVLQLLANPEIHINEVTHIIEQDQALTANILKVANSGYFEPIDEVTTIKKAVLLLGFKMTREITAAFAVKSLFDSLRQVNNFDYITLWKHSLHAAVFSQKIAQIRKQEQDESYISGLLHDIGIVVEFLFDANFFVDLYQISMNKMIPFHELERQKNLSATHDELGYLLLKKWNIPDAIALPVKYHHTIESLPTSLVHFRESTIVVAVGNFFSHYYLIADEQKEEFLRNSSEYRRLKNLYPDLDELFSRLSEEMQKEETFFNLFM